MSGLTDVAAMRRQMVLGGLLTVLLVVVVEARRPKPAPPGRCPSVNCYSRLRRCPSNGQAWRRPAAPVVVLCAGGSDASGDNK